MSASSKGLTFKVTPEMAAQLRNQQDEQEAMMRSITTDSMDAATTKGDENAADETKAVVSSEIAGVTENSNKSKTEKGEGEEGCNNEKDENAKHIIIVEEEKDLPKISIHLERLIGYQPESMDELESIKSQLIAAMWKRFRDNYSSDIVVSNDTTKPPPDFDSQVVEMLETGVATFQPTSMKDDNDDENSKEEMEKLPKEPKKEEPKQQEQQQQLDGYMIMPYPPKLQSPATGEPVSTQKLWNQIVHPHSSKSQIPIPFEMPFIERLWKYFVLCGRNLFWKYDMSIELLRLIQEEQARLDYMEWQGTKRQAKLDNLYSIRETMVHQVDIAKVKYENLKEEREIQVNEAMQPYRRKMAGDSKRFENTSFDMFGTTDLSFPDEFQLLGLRDEEPKDEDDWGLDDDYSSHHSSDDDDYSDEGYNSETSSLIGKESEGKDKDYHDDDNVILRNFPTKTEDDNDAGYECDRDDALPQTLSTGESSNPTTETKPVGALSEDLVGADGAAKLPNSLEVTNSGDSNQPKSFSTPFLRRKERREKAKRRKRQERKDAEKKAKEAQLKALEEEIRAKHTSKEFILAQTMWEALDKKLHKVEELLETLQEEVWEAEEEQEATASSKDAAKDKRNDDDPSFSLLDQILAMILGTTPLQPNVDPKDHYKMIQEEHKSIIKDWKDYFGRLPPAAGNNSSPSIQNEPSADFKTAEQKRMDLGITDNDDDDWEAMDDDDTNDYDDARQADDSKLRDDKEGKVSQGLPTEQKEQKQKPPCPSPKPSSPPKPKVLGLRPGGSLKG